MAITFEEKNEFGKNFLITAATFAVLGGIGFFVWNFLQTAIPEGEVALPATEAPSVDISLLQDPGLAALEPFPAIAPIDPAEGHKRNPFSEKSELELPANDSSGESSDGNSPASAPADL